MRRINRCLRPVDSRPAGGWRPASDSIARTGGRSLAAVIIRRLNRFTIKVGFAQRYAEAREGVDQAIDWGCKPEPPKIPSPQLQSRQDGIQVDELSVAAEGIVAVQVYVAPRRRRQLLDQRQGFRVADARSECTSKSAARIAVLSPEGNAR
jgi:hypothetical protein